MDGKGDFQGTTSCMDFFRKVEEQTHTACQGGPGRCPMLGFDPIEGERLIHDAHVEYLINEGRI
jgi:hypothetical protein